MKSLALAVILLLPIGVAALECSVDYQSTNRTGQPDLPLSESCFSCREIGAFPRDVRNFAYNWIVLGVAGTPSGHLAYNRSVDRLFLDTSVVRLSVPVCNKLGQCATANVVTHFNVREVWRKGVNVLVNDGVDHWRVSVTLANGDTVGAGTYVPGQSKLPVPYNKTADPNAGQCLNNESDPRPEDKKMGSYRPSNSVQNSQSWTQKSTFEHWMQYGVTFKYRCGTASLPGGTSRTTCGYYTW